MSITNDSFRVLPGMLIGSIFRPARILIADDEIVARETLAGRLLGLGYICECCGSGRQALDRLTEKKFDLLVADVLMSEIGCVAFLAEALEIRPNIAVILISSEVDIHVAVEALKHGAYDYLAKPFSLETMSISVSRALEKRRLLLEIQSYRHTLEEQVASRTRELEKALATLEQNYHSTLVALSRALESRDAGSEGRTLRVAAYSARLARQMNITESEIQTIDQGILLHDIGMIGVPDELLRKQDRLDEKERQLICRHPEIGYRILARIKFLQAAAQLVLHHHECYDGSGYPRGLRGDEITPGARIFAVAEAFDRLTSECFPLTSVGFEGISRKLKRMSGNKLDPATVDRFLMIPFQEWIDIHRQATANVG